MNKTNKIILRAIETQLNKALPNTINLEINDGFWEFSNTHTTYRQRRTIYCYLTRHDGSITTKWYIDKSTAPPDKTILTTYEFANPNFPNNLIQDILNHLTKWTQNFQ